MPEQWQLNVVAFRVIVEIESISFIGSDREALIGNPSDFNTEITVLEALGKSTARSYFSTSGTYG